jgi:dihydrofolate reductase
MSKNGVIGVDGDLPWRLSEDLKFFKSHTLGKTVLMGRKTFDSIGRPLPKRKNVVLTRSTSFEAQGVSVVNSIEDAKELGDSELGDSDGMVVIGGAEIYRQVLALGWIKSLYLTRVDCELEGDAHFCFPEDQFCFSKKLLEVEADEKNQFNFTTELYVRA